VATISALVQDPALGNQTTGTNILVTRSCASGTSAPQARGVSVIASVLPIIIVLVVVVIIVLGARRIVKKRSNLDEGEAKDLAGAEPTDFEK